MSVSLQSFIALSSPLKFDIMIDGRYNGQLIFPCSVGSEYSYKEVEMFCRLNRPSLSKKDFSLFLTGKPKFRK